MASASADQLGVLDGSASEYVAARLAKTTISGDGSEGDLGAAAGEGQLGVVGEGSPAGPGPGGASRPGEPGTGRRSASTQQAEAEAEELEDVEEEQDLDVELLLSRAGFINHLGAYTYEIPTGYVKGMNAPARFYASPKLLRLVVGELHSAEGGFTAAVKQLANVATLPGIAGPSIGMPDLHSGYGFAIGNVAAFDMESTKGVVSPGGVGFDINCGVRVLRTSLTEADLDPATRDRLADALFELIPVGVGEAGAQMLDRADLESVLRDGMKWTEKKGLSWPEDRQVCEEQGCFAQADPSKVSDRAKKRGLMQMGSLGSGNHYTEIQVVDKIYDHKAASAMGIDREGQVCVMIHTGSRGLGHQVCTDALAACDRAVKVAGIKLVDRQLACMPISSPEGQDYLKAMAAAANFAFCNRTVVMSCVRRAFERVFGRSARQLGMHMVYDVAHNVAKQEQHSVGGRQVRVLVHRKGATRAFPPHHPEIPEKYKEIGQPVLIGGSMGTASYILTGTQGAMEHTFGSTCHGAGRALSRSKAKAQLESKDVLRALQARGISIRVSTKHLAAEEAPESYKDVDEVVDTCHGAGISCKAVRLRPVAVVKG